MKVQTYGHTSAVTDKLWGNQYVEQLDMDPSDLVPHFYMQVKINLFNVRVKNCSRHHCLLYELLTGSKSTIIYDTSVFQVNCLQIFIKYQIQ